MRRSFALALMLGLCSHSASAALNFSPDVEEYSSEGFTYRKVTLKSDEGKVVYVPPIGWTVRGSGDKLQLTPPRKNFAEASIGARQPATSPEFDEAAVASLEQQILSEAPTGAQSVKVVSREANPVIMGSDQSYGFVLSYVVLGQTFQKSVIYVRNKDAELIFRCAAVNADFVSLAQAFRRSLGSWQWVEAKPSTVASVSVATPASVK